MADDEQLTILSQGAAAWNAWRMEQPEIIIDLAGANLRHMNLENANLSSVTFDQNIGWDVLTETGMDFKKIRKRKYDILLDTTIRCKGVKATTCYGSQMFKLFLLDQDFLEEFLDKRRGKQVFIVWWVFASKLSRRGA
jgi:hypothetical protein